MGGMKLPENSGATFVKVAIAFAIFAAGYYFPLFRPGENQPVPAAKQAPSAPATRAPMAAR